MRGKSDSSMIGGTLKDDSSYDKVTFTDSDLDLIGKNEKEFRIMKLNLRQKRVKSKYIDKILSFEELKQAYDVVMGIFVMDEGLNYEVDKAKNLEDLNNLFAKTRDLGKLYCP